MPDQTDHFAQSPFPPHNASQPSSGMRQTGPINQTQRPMPPSSQPFSPIPPAGSPVPPPSAEAPPTVTSPYYMAGYLRGFIGRFVRVEFSLGTSGALNDRIGILRDVGASFIVLEQFPSRDITIADLYSIKFVTVYEERAMPAV